MEFFFDEPVKPQQRANRIFLAATKGDVERFTELLETQDPFVLVNGLNCLHIACKKKHLGIVKKMLEANPSSISSTTGDDLTPLMLAASEGDVEVIRTILDKAGMEKRTFVNVQNSAGNSALHICVWNGHEECCRVLVEEFGADVGAKNKDKMSPIQFAAAGNHVNIVEYLGSVSVETDTETFSASGLNSLHRACMHGALETVMALVARSKMDPNVAAYGSGNNALHLAAMGGYTSIVKYLVENTSVERNAQNKSGLTALHFACAGAHLDTAQLLLHAGCDAQMCTLSGATPLHLAAGAGNHELCRSLAVLPDTDLTSEDESGQTPIDMALTSGFKELASKLAYWTLVSVRAKSILKASEMIAAL